MKPNIFDGGHEVVSSHLVTRQFTDGKGVVRTVSYVVEIWRITKQ